MCIRDRSGTKMQTLVNMIRIHSMTLMILLLASTGIACDKTLQSSPGNLVTTLLTTIRECYHSQIDSSHITLSTVDEVDCSMFSSQDTLKLTALMQRDHSVKRLFMEQQNNSGHRNNLIEGRLTLNTIYNYLCLLYTSPSPRDQA
eukprot:TRINITY_DN22492_c0_g1_i1.p1 TRINITY_DN22492_c0_g1~~TRINITY_DN22492_c0_g1_i1.p1  ORF type:complete len:157 (-),score=20.49 TRINITY_DN22492_c0_g1_i1:32-466(-)